MELLQEYSMKDLNDFIYKIRRESTDLRTFNKIIDSYAIAFFNNFTIDGDAAPNALEDIMRSAICEEPSEIDKKTLINYLSLFVSEERIVGYSRDNNIKFKHKDSELNKLRKELVNKSDKFKAFDKLTHAFDNSTIKGKFRKESDLQRYMKQFIIENTNYDVKSESSISGSRHRIDLEVRRKRSGDVLGLELKLVKVNRPGTLSSLFKQMYDYVKGYKKIIVMILIDQSRSKHNSALNLKLQGSFGSIQNDLLEMSHRIETNNNYGRGIAIHCALLVRDGKDYFDQYKSLPYSLHSRLMSACRRYQKVK
ncbi:MAG: hypothetical protein ACP5UD_09925 [Conexivisphaera sp.]